MGSGVSYSEVVRISAEGHRREALNRLVGLAGEMGDDPKDFFTKAAERLEEAFAAAEHPRTREAGHFRRSGKLDLGFRYALARTLMSAPVVLIAAHWLPDWAGWLVAVLVAFWVLWPLTRRAHVR